MTLGGSVNPTLKKLPIPNSDAAGNISPVIPTNIPNANMQIQNPNMPVGQTITNITPSLPPMISNTSVADQLHNTQPAIIRDGNTGEITGVQMPDGSIHTGLNAADVTMLVNGYNKTRTAPAGSVEMSGLMQQQQSLNQANQLAGQIGNTQPVTPDQLAINNQLNNVGAEAIHGAEQKALLTAGGAAITGGVGLAGALAGGAALSATGVGLAVGLPLIAGAIGGAIYGYISSRNTALKANAVQATTMARVDFSTSKADIKVIIDGANKGIIDPVTAVNLYNIELQKIDQAEANMKYEATIKPQTWLKNQDELTKIAQFNQVQRAQTSALLYAAIANPNPNQVLTMPQDITDITDGSNND